MNSSDLRQIDQLLTKRLRETEKKLTGKIDDTEKRVIQKLSLKIDEAESRIMEIVEEHKADRNDVKNLEGELPKSKTHLSSTKRSFEV